MRNLNKNNITEAVVKSLEKALNPRMKRVFSSMIRHMHDFVREVELTQDEWETAMNFLYKAGDISTPVRHEFILTSDVLGVTSLVDLLQDKAGGGNLTESSVLGPFYVENSPMLEFGGDLIQDNLGEPGVMLGRVLDQEGHPIAGAMVDVWQTADSGLYQAADPSQPDGNLRCRMLTNAEGRYQFNTIKPVSYKVPEDGAGGDMLEAMGRHPWRPAHVHFKVTASGYSPLVTELYVEEDKYIDEDAVFGVRDSLAVSFKPSDDAQEAARYKLKAPFWKVEYDFGLKKED